MIITDCDSHIVTSDESLAYEVCRVCWDPVTPFPGILRVAGAEDAEEKIVVASVGGDMAAPPGLSVLHSHWSRNVEARLSLVESFIVMLRHKEPA